MPIYLNFDASAMVEYSNVPKVFPLGFLLILLYQAQNCHCAVDLLYCCRKVSAGKVGAVGSSGTEGLLLQLHIPNAAKRTAIKCLL